MSDPRPRRAAIVGFIGFGNLGDELILAGIEQLLAPMSVDVTTLFGGPELAETRAFAHARRQSPWRHLPTPNAIRELRRADLLVIGGGGLFNDHWPLLIPRYLSWVVAARLVGTTVAWIGVGVGPIRHRRSRWLTRLAARLSSPVLVRDQASAAVLGGASRRVKVIPDPAMFLDPPRPARSRAILGLIVRAPVHDRQPDVIALVELLAQFAAAGRSSGLRPLLLMMDPAADRPFAERVAGRLARDGARAATDVLGPSEARTWQQLGELRAVVSVRLHGVLLSAMGGVPCVPIAYDDKVTEASHRLGLGDVVLGPGHVSDDAVARTLATVQDPGRARQVAARVSALRDQVDDVRRLLR